MHIRRVDQVVVLIDQFGGPHDCKVWRKVWHKTWESRLLSGRDIIKLERFHGDWNPAGHPPPSWHGLSGPPIAAPVLV